MLVVIAHADDLSLFIGGTVAAWADHGWRVVVVRVTDDRWDSLGLSEEATIAANTAELNGAAKILGVSEIVELRYATDVLGDASEVALREKIIRQIRTHRPYALVSFDPYARNGEDNQDHLLVAAATDEAFWTSQFDKHHPEHLDDGLAVHGCFERWYFGRKVVDVTDVIDITHTIDRKVAAGCSHTTMMTNFFHQLHLQATTGGWVIDAVDEALAHGDISALLAQLIRAGSEQTGRGHGVAAAEEFRVVRFGGLQGLLDRLGRRVEP